MFVVKRDFIEHGYRTSITETPITLSQCAVTVFRANHNEVCNIWTHLLPGLYFLWQLLQIAFGIGVYGEFKTAQSTIIQAFEALLLIFCMFSSATYHAFSPLSNDINKRLLKIDLIGIGFMVFGLTIIGVYIGFHNWPFERNLIVCMMILLLLTNLIFQMTPCYIQDEYEWCRIAFYTFTVAISIGLALLGRFYFGTEEEIRDYYPTLQLSFFYLFLGFFFYIKKVPECVPGLQKY